MTDDPRAQSEQAAWTIAKARTWLLNLVWPSTSAETYNTPKVRATAQLLSELGAAHDVKDAEIARLKHELAMATDAANKGDDARTKAGAMQDQISDLRNIIAGMFWAGGSIDDKTMGDIRALGLDCRAENAALAKLVDELAELPNDARENWLGLADLKRRAQALRAGQQKGTER